MQESLCCAEHKAVKLFRELEQTDLIERKRRGLGRPSLIYVKNSHLDCQKRKYGIAQIAILVLLKMQFRCSQKRNLIRLKRIKLRGIILSSRMKRTD